MKIEGIFCTVYFVRREFLSQCTVYWMHFLNIHTFPYQKHYFIHFCSLFLKSSKVFIVSLTILTGKISVLLSTVQELVKIGALLLLAFFLCLHDQLISIHCHISKSTIFEKSDLSHRQKINVCSFQQGLRQNLSLFLF